MTKTLLSLAVLISVVAILGGVSAFTHFSAGSLPAYDDTDPSAVALYWAGQIQNHGAGVAYAEFKEKNARAAEQGRHLSAHIIGEKIYESEGISGIRYCDASFSFGCYHGFFGQAFAQGGIDSIEELDAVCVRSFGPLGTGCQHGIGHGVLEYVGYQNITDALAICEKTTKSAPLLGCVSGVFMEYNMPLVGISDTLIPQTRAFSKETADEPCRLVKETYKKSCYFELGGWLDSALYGDYEKIGEVCGSFTVEWRAACFQGFGAMLPQRMHYNSESSRAICEVFEGDDMLFCRAGVAWAMYSVPEHRGKTESACADNDAVRNARCMEAADLTQGKSGFPNL